MKIAKKIKRIVVNYLRSVKSLNINRIKAYLLFAHYFFCMRRYHCNVEEYFAYNFYKISHEIRKKFLLVYHQRNMYKLINLKGFTRSKGSFAKRFPTQFGRDFLQIESCQYSDFAEFFKKHQRIIMKPDDASYGRDIQVFDYKDVSDAFMIFSQYKDKNYICEEYIKQHPAMDALNPNSVNTVRVLVLLEDGEVNVIAAALRTGKRDCVVDNLKHGGIGANVNIETGMVDTIGMDYSGETYRVHPDTGHSFIGLQIPFWKETLSMIREVHLQCSQCPLLGWDIAVTEEGPVIVETNNAPGPMIHQFIDKVPRGEEIIAFIEKRKLSAQNVM